MPDLFALTRPLLQALDPETAHQLGVKALAWLPRGAPEADDPQLATTVFGVRFPNPVGMAAGFDKHAEAIDGVLGLGAGFTEIGGVTPLPQPGNPRPRVFRLPEDEAVINRYGLNSVGMAVVAERLSARRAAGRQGVVGVNLGANKESVDRAGDYARLALRLAPLADFLTINVSSPNTPGLRDLQGEAALDDLVARTLAARDEAAGSGQRTPVLIKIAPDLDETGLDAILTVALNRAVDGLVIANTTVARPASLKGAARAETGGLSGRPLFEPSTRLLAQAAVRLEGRLPLVGVGGVEDGASALAKIEAGASLVQLYTALIYRGPGLFRAITRDLVRHLDAVGAARLSDLVGRRAATIAAGEPLS